MKLIVIRHALRERLAQDFEEYCEKTLPLSEAGIHQAKELAGKLTTLGCNPAVYYTSCFVHARQTAAIIRGVLANASAEIVELCSLTPHYQGPREWRDSVRKWTGLEILKTVQMESECLRRGVRQFDTIAIILHKPRIEQLIAGITSEQEGRFRDLDYGSACLLQAPSFNALFQGRVEHTSIRLNGSP
jgi:broad specificity phosphatase PhoE